MYLRGIDFKAAGVNCEECPLSLNPVVPGYGNDDADIVLIGEAPGETEMKRGKPFVGRSGQLLDSVLEKVGISRDDLWITNTCLCRPDDNRTPTKKERGLCYDRLIEEIKGVDPKIIVVMGNTALETLTGKKGITKYIGGYEYNEDLNMWIVYSIHPAAGLRRPGWADDLETSFRLVKRMLEEKGLSLDVSLNYEVMDNPEDFRLPPAGEKVVDLEWSSNQEVLCMGVGTADRVWVYSRDVMLDEECGSQLREYLTTTPLVGQNFKSDINVLSRDVILDTLDLTQADDWVENGNYVDDTMLMSYALDPRRGIHGLKMLAKRYLHVGEYDKPIKKYITHMEDCPPDLMYKYNAQDIIYNSLLKDILWEEMDEQARTLYTNRLMPAARALVAMEVRGVSIDRMALMKLDTQLTADLEKISEEIYELAGCEFNLNSHQQKQEVLFDKLRLPLPKKRSADEASLNMLVKYHPIVPKLQDYSKMSKIHGTYVKGMEKKLVGSKIHTNFNLHITATGRLSSSGPNLQNIPTRTDLGKSIKRLFIPSSRDYYLYEYDYSQAELRVLAYLSGDKTLLRAFREGEDIHAVTTAGIYDIPPEEVTSEQRAKGKTANFAILYGVSPKGLMRQLGVDMKEAQQIIDGWFNTYPLADKYMSEQRNKALKEGYVETATGRVRRFPAVGPANGSIARQAGNTPVQGTAADITLDAVIELEKVSRGIPFNVLLTVHDSVLLEAPDDFDVEIPRKIMLEKAADVVEGVVPFAVDIKKGKNWGDAEEIE